MPCPPRVIAVGAAVPAAVVPMPGDAAGVNTVVAVELLPRTIMTVPFARTMPNAPSPPFPPPTHGPPTILLLDPSKIAVALVARRWGGWVAGAPGVRRFSPTGGGAPAREQGARGGPPRRPPPGGGPPVGRDARRRHVRRRRRVARREPRLGVLQGRRRR